VVGGSRAAASPRLGGRLHHGRLDEGVSLITKPFTATGLAGKVRRVLDDVPDGGPSG